MGWYWDYTPRKPKTVKGGIKAHSKKGAFGQSWWARRWNQTLEGYDIGQRLNRGKSYARKGQVASIKIQKGKITAIVQGSEQYHVKINISALKDAQWDEIAKGAFSNPAIVAELLAGQLPNDIEDVFKDHSIRLFPSHRDINTDCTCPDWSNPCKHIAAVYLLLAEEFDRDPFLIFRLRGIERKEFLKRAGIHDEKKSISVPAKDKKPAKGAESRDKKKNRVAIISTTLAKKSTTRKKTLKKTTTLVYIDPKKFWKSLDDQIVESVKHADAAKSTMIPAIPASLIRQIGGFPFWRGNINFMDTMEDTYIAASNAGVDVLFGEYEDDFSASANGENDQKKNKALY